MNEPIHRESALLNAALELQEPERRAYLDRACAGDAALRQRIEALIQAHEQAAGFQETHADLRATAPLETSPAERAGDRIGRYKLLQQIGEGGCGVVYMAEQEEPVRRRVALKILKLGMDTKQVIARFEAERQALAMMDHPNIASVLDAGATETGRPYFVMELVRGIKITEFCDESNLSTEERLKLFVQVCQAIQHAHQKGIIHRDVKPSNILVTINDGVPVPKVIDFGIAKATQGRLTNQTLFTAFEQFLGTPAYMSPEQAAMTSLDIDTRSDIYSLGVLLNELLTGRTPFDPKELLAAGLDAMRRTIREQEPPRPSTQLSSLAVEDLTTTAQRRRTEPAKLLHVVRGDLDWIVMKCLEKDRARRYETANGVAADILRYLNCEPVIARPPGKLYEFQKTVRRHKVGFAATAAIILVLAAGIALTAWQARRATSALNELRASAPAFLEQARALVATEQFDEAIDKLDYATRLRPDVVEYLVAKGDLLQCQLKLAEAAVVYREALRLKPDLARAETSAALCEELLAAAVGNQGELTRESLARLYSAMQTQQRPAAELMPVARLLGRENELLLEYWFARLKDLPLPHETPLKDRLTIREDGRLALDLRRTKVTDLSSLAGAPLAVLDLSGSRELTDLSGLRGLDLIELDLAETSVANLTPLREMRTLKRLSLAYSRVTDLGPLGALQLDHLNLEGTRVFDLSPLRGMALTRINLQNTRVSDLSPLAGMPLTHFEASAIAAIDYSPLAGAPLTYCCIQSSPVRDLSFLRDSPVKELILFDCNEARGFSVLAGLKSLDLLILPPVIRDLPEDEMAAIESLRNHPTLRSIAAPERREGAWSLRTIQPEADFWKQWDRERAATRPLAEAGFRFAFTRLQNGSFRLEVIDEPLRDLSFLEGAPLSELVLMGTAITNLNPLKGLPLTTLDIRRTPVADLTPLRDPTLSANLKFLEVWNIPALDFSPVAACTNLEWFDACGTALADLHVVSGRKLRVALLNGTRITNISVLAGMPLERLMINDTGVTDLTPLLHCPTLRELGIPRGAHDVVALRALPLLGRLSYRSTLGGFSAQTAEEFWAEYDYGGITAEAIPLLASRAAGNPEDTLASLEIAVLHAWFGQAAEHEAHCARLIAAAERPDSAMTTIDRAAKSWILMPSTNTALLDRALKLARKPVAQSRSSDPFLAWYQLTLGLAELRAGHDREAEAALVQAEHLADVLQYPADARLWVKGPARLYRAMAYSRNGRTEEALQLFRQASAEMPALPENADKVLSSSADLHTVIYWLAHREAKALLGVER